MFAGRQPGSHADVLVIDGDPLADIRILQDKGHLTFWLNGIKTFEGQMGSDEWNKMVAGSKFSHKEFADFAKVAKGKIALQEHPGSSQWRNIKIKTW